MKRVLIISHMGQMIAQFSKEDIEILRKLGFEVHLAANFNSVHNTMTLDAIGRFKSEMLNKGVFLHQIDFQRKIGTVKSNYKSWKELMHILGQSKFELIHCQSPLGGVFGRILGHKFNIPVIYTAHGFHFYKGGPLKNWLIYYPVEWALARYTDNLITINHEDDKIASKFPCRNHTYIPGVGVDTEKLNNLKKDVSMRKLVGIPQKSFVIVSVGELSENKNPDIVIRALANLRDKDIYYVAVGKGPRRAFLEQLAINEGVADRVVFPGYSENPEFYYRIADISAFPSRREGLGLAGIEAMATGLPLLTTNAGGIADYSVDGETGFVIKPDDVNLFSDRIRLLKENSEVRERISTFNKQKSREFSIKKVNKIMNRVYSRYM
ncbi:glycosyltransferase [Lacticaseibacillus paracasei]|uniref:glycosyltransferase n=1 Tax=Lacticaseibacillus paracasei TaxID=1597 RepID=UPI002B2310A2|nr:glycosyltransferase [Lacticaseibacillus paracasei]MEB0329406.1 glycosyltransferase [Lacticaseibacillus paracasei]